MKPKEFDELLKQKFEQNDFEYNPANWDRLEEELDGRSKRRGVVAGWIIPLMGMAASIALAFGISFVWKSGSTGDTYQYVALSAEVMRSATTQVQDGGNAIASIGSTAVTHNIAVPLRSSSNKASKAPVTSVVSNVATAPDNQPLQTKNEPTDEPLTLASTDSVIKKKKKLFIDDEAIYTFKKDISIPKTLKTSIILSGGFNFGNQTNGYSFGASARHMINSKVYVEGDIAFTGATNSQNVLYLDQTAGRASYAGVQASGAGLAAKSTLTSKSSSGSDLNEEEIGGTPGVLKTANKQYNLYYAQITPSIGYKIMKRMSIGIGPDFQQMLVDNRPEASTVDRGNIREAPMFDIGFMGKTEFAFSKNIKAAVYYREGINNVITPTNKYIDRNYLQVQLKCAILNK